MIYIDKETFVYIKAFLWIILFFSIYYPFSNLLKISYLKKKKRFWDDWLTKGISHEQYVEKYQQQNEEISCSYCNATKQGHQLEQALPKEVKFGFIENTISDKKVHYLSHYCARCCSQLFRHSHEV